MDMEPKKIESMDDLRAAMNDPEIQAASKEFSKKYLKANRPKSLAVVIFAVTAILLMMGLSNHKASSVTPVALRTADAVTVVLADDTSDAAEPQTLTGEQREAAGTAGVHQGQARRREPGGFAGPVLSVLRGRGQQGHLHHHSRREPDHLQQLL